MSVASLSGILEGGAHVAPPRANEPIFDSVRIRVKTSFTIDPDSINFISTLPPYLLDIWVIAR